jgi:hypothetical protein
MAVPLVRNFNMRAGQGLRFDSERRLIPLLNGLAWAQSNGSKLKRGRPSLPLSGLNLTVYD